MNEITDLLVIHHTHTDVGYTHPQPVFWDLSRRFIDEAIDLCDDTADWPEDARMKWTCEVTAPVMDWLRHADDRQIDRFAAAAKRGQIAVGAMWCNMTPLYSLEQFAQSLLPVRELRERFELPVSVAINHDVNGLPWSVIPLLLDAGVSGLLMGINIHFGGYPLERRLGFRWQGPDGRSLLSFNGEHYQSFDSRLHLAERNVTTDRMAEGLAAYLEKLKQTDYAYDFIYLTATHPAFCDNNPPNPSLPRLVRQWNDEGRTPRIRLVTPEAVIERLNRQPSEHVPIHRGDWTDFWNFGSGSAALEVAVNRRARSKLYASQTLAARFPYSEKAVTCMNRARWSLNLHDEHTWGAFCSVLSKCPTLYMEQWAFKAVLAYEASSLSAMLLRDQLEALAENPKQGDGADGYLLYNPAPTARRLCIPVHQPLADGAWRHLSSSVHKLDAELTLRREECEIYAIDTVTLGPIDVPARSCIIVSRDALPPAKLPASITAEEGLLESSHHRLRFDPATGRVLALDDTSLGRNIVDASADLEFFGFVRETVTELNERARTLRDAREAFFTSDWKALHEMRSGWVSDWKARRAGPSGIVSIQAERTPDGPRLVRRYQADGVDDLTQIITLCEHEPTVRLETVFKKEDVRDPEGVYLAFPLAMNGWRAHFDTAGLAAEFDAEQLPGCCRDWVTADSYIAMYDEQWCAMVACPDAPLFQLGDFTFARRQAAVPDRGRSLLLAWPMNNYWHTNFRPSQPGYCRLRYELRCAARFDPYEAALFGRTAASVVEIHPVVQGADQRTLEIAALEGEGVTLDHLKPAETDGGLIARIVNHRDVAQTAIVRLAGRQLEAAHRCDTLEQPVGELETSDDRVHLSVPPRSIATIRLRLRPQGASSGETASRCSLAARDET